jgi:hypothetical protein
MGCDRAGTEISVGQLYNAFKFQAGVSKTCRRVKSPQKGIGMRRIAPSCSRRRGALITQLSLMIMVTVCMVFTAPASGQQDRCYPGLDCPGDIKGDNPPPEPPRQTRPPQQERPLEPPRQTRPPRQERSYPPELPGQELPSYQWSRFTDRCIITGTEIFIDEDGNITPEGRVVYAGKHERCAFDIVSPNGNHYCVNREDGRVLRRDEQGWYSVGYCRKLRR